ncbi:MAG: magnesium transporter [Flavobacteriales bacterium]|nr:magnesium transporter [Bacteroidota bacterium]MCB9240053.1 magnesium transporter [Flavobacteriales bacterium]
MENFHITKEFSEEILAQVREQRETELASVLDRLHAADIAELFESFELEEALYVTSLLDDEKRVNVLAELEPDVRESYLQSFSSDQIAKEFLQHMESDDAVDLLSELDPEQAGEVIASIDDREHSLLLTSMMRYPDDAAGGLMASELIKVNINWDVRQCTEEIRQQAEEVSKVFTVYVVDDNDILLGIVSLKQIVLAKASTKISEIFESNVVSVNAYTSGEEVASKMTKYDLVAIPVVDALNRLIGRITFDDVMDFVREEADKDYQMLSGISENVEVGDKVWVLSRARLPWLIIGLFGGVMSSIVIGGFEEEIARNVSLAFFMPLVMAMGGNAGVQSSSIVVQGLANNTVMGGSILPRLGKEFMVALINALVCSAIALLYGLVSKVGYEITIVVCISLFSAIIFASLMGALIPLVLDIFKIDPALATGPFITTSNDLLGLFIYFVTGHAVL